MTSDRERIDACMRELASLKLDISIMHVCGTHQESLMRHGLLGRFSEAGVRILQGPGCPVCVTTPREIEEALALARGGVRVCAFGDLMRVPGATGSLASVRSEGADVEVVYSPEDAVRFAGDGKPTCMVGIGFETTAPSTALVLADAPPSFTVLSCHRVIPPALDFIARSGEVRIQGLIQPGHVSAIIGTAPYEFLSTDYHLPQVVTGFEALDLAQGILMLARQVSGGRAEVENQYTRVVRRDGNPVALKAMRDAFVPGDGPWRGFPVIPRSVLALSERHSEHDARSVHAGLLEPMASVEFGEPPGCLCGEVLRGVRHPSECPMFSKKCTPETPIGPCMVSREGVCAIEHRYGRKG